MTPICAVPTVTTPTATATGKTVPTPSVAITSTVTQRRPRISGLWWRCRSCGKDPCEGPTATQCGHIFCHSCIMKEIVEKMQCPVCSHVFLLKLHARR
ncbi:uncharacterized protein B0H18DRAFT_1058865 [Fomitopsis serialis]|uniref:uncharacterized protein n=1 Tax=Fomitopsis serialis TaxID=139415 RepID=UPI002008114E|nr:uncharacterized protein B0H18DRAFT_1058865 [Neoantrodia serialis]KAH9911806.1 hypothetical protein B0H18DRAFT_1058865 [Neoantrodia serialis]